LLIKIGHERNREYEKQVSQIFKKIMFELLKIRHSYSEVRMLTLMDAASSNPVHH
jgi:hypothetical protein